MASEAGLPLLLKQLKLTAIKDIWEEMAIKASDDRWSHAEYFAALMEIQANSQEEKRIKRYTKEAKLPCGKFLGTFDFSSVPDLNRAQIEAYSKDTSWVKRSENIMLFGPSGLGKTHIASGIAYGLIQEGIRTLFVSTSELTQKLQAAKSELSLPNALCRLDRYELLVLDDIGYSKKDEMETTVLFDLIAHRYESKSIIVTSNKPFSKWDDIFPDSMMAVAAIDRLVHHARIYNLTGESYRKKHSISRENFDNENSIENGAKPMLNSES